MTDHDLMIFSKIATLLQNQFTQKLISDLISEPIFKLFYRSKGYLNSHTRTIRKRQTGFAIIGTPQWRVSNQRGTEPLRCRPSVHGTYHSTTWLYDVADVVGAFISE